LWVGGKGSESVVSALQAGLVAFVVGFLDLPDEFEGVVFGA